MSGLFGLGQALLLVFDPERAHELAIKSIELGLYPRKDGPDDERLAQTLFGLDFPNPLGMAAGFDKNARVPRELLAMGFGFAEAGTITPRPQPGNPAPRVFRSHADHAIVNRLGFNNEGQAAVLARLEGNRPPGVAGINLGANRDSSDLVADYVAGVKRMAPVASYFAINISSPNTPGLRDLQAPRRLDDLLRKVQDARAALPDKAPPLLVKLAPDLADADLPDVVGVIEANRIDGIIISNTTLARDNLHDQTLIREAGGLSGRPAFLRTTRMLARVYQLVNDKLPLIGVGGIDSGETALAKIEAGASLIQLYTGLVFEGPGLIDRIKRTLIDALAAEKSETLAPLIGRRASDWADAKLPELVV